MLYMHEILGITNWTSSPAYIAETESLHLHSAAGMKNADFTQVDDWHLCVLVHRLEVEQRNLKHE